MSDYTKAVAAAQREVDVATAQLKIIQALRPLNTERRAQLIRFLVCAVENDCLDLLRTTEAPREPQP